MKRFFLLLFTACVLIACNNVVSGVITDTYTFPDEYRNFSLSGKMLISPEGSASLFFAKTESSEGYTVCFNNGPIDGSIKTGSLLHIRNLYRSIVNDDEWFDFSVVVKNEKINVKINDIDVVCYAEPDSSHVWRTASHLGQVIQKGKIGFEIISGHIELKDVKIFSDPTLSSDLFMDPIDERNDSIIRLQQRDFPVIDYHVHLKGDLTKELAHKMSMSLGINYGVAPNAGEGGVGEMFKNDSAIYRYYDDVKAEPFLLGVQGEGRKWTQVFSKEALGTFEYLFTDAMTIVDQCGRISRLYHDEEVLLGGLSHEKYMDHIVDQTVLILTNEPADIYANPTFLPSILQPEYDNLWTDARINRVLDVLETNKIALEINPRYRIPSMKIIKMAKQRGIKFTFGTNNMDSNIGKLEYCIEAINECSLTPSDIWFPSYSIRSARPTVIYNHFDK